KSIWAIPGGLPDATAKAAMAFVAGSPVSPRAAALANGMLKPAFAGRLTTAVSLLLATVACGLGVGWAAFSVPPRNPAELNINSSAPPPARLAEADAKQDALSIPAPGLSADWPQWRGPNRDGVVHGVTAPEKWPKVLTEEWQVPVGKGVASPV